MSVIFRSVTSQRAALSKRLWQGLAHLRLIAAEDFIVGDDAFENHAGPKRQRFYIEEHYGPACFGIVYSTKPRPRFTWRSL